MQKINDGRFVVIAFIAFYIVGLILATDLLGYDKGMRLFDIPPMLPAFADLHVIVGGYETALAGINPYITNPYDPWQRLLNYPRIWMYLGDLGLTHQNIFFAGVIIGLLFIITIFKILGRITPAQGIYCALVICSSSTVLAVERGNNDLIIFMLMALAVYLTSSAQSGKNVLTGAVVITASILKLYPIFSLPMLLDSGKPRFIKLALAVMVVFIIYLIANLVDLSFILQNTPHGGNRSFGSAILPSKLLLTFNQQLFIENRQHFIYAARLIGSISLLLVLAGVLFSWRHSFKNSRQVTTTDQFKLNLFRTGVSIYIGTFALGYNFDYRLIFLILTVPQLLDWYASSLAVKRHAFVTLGLILALMQWNFFSTEWNMRIITLNELTSWVLLGYLWYLFLASLPDWVRTDWLRIKVTPRESGN